MAYLELSGGLGDVIWQYHTKLPWLCALDAKEKLGIDLDVCLYSHNQQSKELLRYNPYIRKVYEEQFGIIPTRSGTGWWEVFPELNQKYQIRPMPIYLHASE